MIPNIKEYLKSEVEVLNRIWPNNQTFNMVCHGHSIPCGYTSNHVVKMLDAYPRLLHEILCGRFPMAVTNVIVSAIGGEASVSGAKRFEEEVLCYKPRIITIDYGRNDMFLPINQVETSWGHMIEKALEENIKVILVSPAPDSGQLYYEVSKRQNTDDELTVMIESLAHKYEVAFADVCGAFKKQFTLGHSVDDFMISVNHLNRNGSLLIANEIIKWFPY